MQLSNDAASQLSNRFAGHTDSEDSDTYPGQAPSGSFELTDIDNSMSDLSRYNVEDLPLPTPDADHPPLDPIQTSTQSDDQPAPRAPTIAETIAEMKRRAREHREAQQTTVVEDDWDR